MTADNALLWAYHGEAPPTTARSRPLAPRGVVTSFTSSLGRGSLRVRHLYAPEVRSRVAAAEAGTRKWLPEVAAVGEPQGLLVPLFHHGLRRGHDPQETRAGEGSEEGGEGEEDRPAGADGGAMRSGMGLGGRPEFPAAFAACCWQDACKMLARCWRDAAGMPGSPLGSLPWHQQPLGPGFRLFINTSCKRWRGCVGFDASPSAGDISKGSPQRLSPQRL